MREQPPSLEVIGRRRRRSEGPLTDWKACLHQLLTARVPAWRDNARQTVGQCLAELEELRSDFSARHAKHELALAGLGLLLPGEVADCELGYVLAVPNSSPLVAQLFDGTEWGVLAGLGGAWKDALHQAPPEIVITDKRINRMRIRGVQHRCSLVVLKNFHGASER
jgi:hypothetical protein